MRNGHRTQASAAAGGHVRCYAARWPPGASSWHSSRVSPTGRRGEPGARKAAERCQVKSQSKAKRAGQGSRSAEMPRRGCSQLVVSIGDQHAHALQRRHAHRAGAGLDRHAEPSDADGYFQRHREGPLASLEPLRRAPMYYMHRLTWSGIALHEGMLPGYAASHGCIRMPTDFVSQLWTSASSACVSWCPATT